MSAELTGDVRPSPIAGTWYPDKPDQLADAIDQMLESAPTTKILGPIRGLVVPHAGYRYSGAVAARAFRLVQGMAYDQVVVISPMHHTYSASILTSAHAAYRTPLGSIPINTQILDALSAYLAITRVRNDPEHSLEIELPFLQRALATSFQLIPLMLRDQSFRTAEQISQALANVIDNPKSTLLIASSDLSHFYSEEVAHHFDNHLMTMIEANDPQGIIKADEDGTAFACGRGAIAAVLLTARAMGAATVLKVGYGTSADTSGDVQSVVGYGSAIIFEGST